MVRDPTPAHQDGDRATSRIEDECEFTLVCYRVYRLQRATAARVLAHGPSIYANNRASLHQSDLWEVVLSPTAVTLRASVAPFNPAQPCSALLGPARPCSALLSWRDVEILVEEVLRIVDRFDARKSLVRRARIDSGHAGRAGLAQE